MKLKPKFKNGDICRIIGNTSEHQFDLDDIVTIIRYIKDDDDGIPAYKCSENDHDYWFVRECDLELKSTTDAE